MSRLRALSLAAGLVGWSLVSPRLPAPWRIPLQAGLGSVLVLVTRATMGLWPPRLWAGLRLGWAAGAAAATAIAATTPVPMVRLSMSARELPASVPVWLVWHIPGGTVWAGGRVSRGAGHYRCPGLRSVGWTDTAGRRLWFVSHRRRARDGRAAGAHGVGHRYRRLDVRLAGRPVRQSGSTAADALGHQRGRCGRRGAGPAAFWYLDSTVIAGSGPW